MTEPYSTPIAAAVSGGVSMIQPRPVFSDVNASLIRLDPRPEAAL
jgi:hypothetical protein